MFSLKIVSFGVVGCVSFVAYDYLFAIKPVIVIDPSKNRDQIFVKILNVSSSNNCGEIKLIKHNIKPLEDKFITIKESESTIFNKYHGPTFKFKQPNNQEIFSDFIETCVKNRIYTEIQYKNHFGITITKNIYW